MLKPSLSLLPLALIVLTAAFLRLYQLDTLPISLFGDEIDVGYHALSLWTTGKDYMGNFLPTYIQSLAEYRAPLLMYVTAPFVGLLGPSTLSVRLPVALLGIINVLQIYFLTLHLTKNKTTALLAAALLALTPWHLHYSRAAFESILLLSLILCGTHCFLKYLQSPKGIYLLFPVPFALAFYTYSTANVFVPLFVLALVIFNKDKALSLLKQKNKINLYLPLLLGLVLTLPIAYQILAGSAASRFRGISVFTDTRITDVVVTLRTEPWATTSLERLFHNKLTATFAPIAANYLQSFSPQFLYLHGDLFNRHSVATYGELIAVTLPFLLLGLFLAVQKKYWLLIAWLLLSPLPSTLTREGGMHATRLFLMLPPLTIITALGLSHFLILTKSKFMISLSAVVLILALFNFSSYWHYYTTHYRYLSAPIWQYGYEQILTKLQPRLSTSNRIFINNTHEPSLLRFAFFTKLPPRQFHQNFQGDVPTSGILPAFDGFKFGRNYYFGRVEKYENLTSLLQPGDIYLAVQLTEVPGDWDWSKTPPAGLKSLDMVTNPRGQPLFYLLTHE